MTKQSGFCICCRKIKQEKEKKKKQGKAFSILIKILDQPLAGPFLIYFFFKKSTKQFLFKWQIAQLVASHP